jgi:glycosyltransferase involved in cell wall biosynthesis
MQTPGELSYTPEPSTGAGKIQSQSGMNGPGSRPKFRILIVTFTFPPTKDGVSETARAMAENFAAHGHVVTVATGYSPERTSEWHEPGIQVKQFRVHGSPHLREGIHGEVEAFKNFVGNFEGDFVISHCWQVWSSSLAEAMFPKFGSAKRIMMSQGFSAHQWFPHRRFPWGIGFWLGWQPWVWTFPQRLRKYDHLVVTSPRANCERFFDHLVAKATFYRKVTVIPNGTDPEKFDSAAGDFRKQFGLEDKLVFLNVANYSERKNQEFAVRAFAHANLDKAVLVLVGSEFNSYSERVRRVANELGLTPDRVIFVERLSREMTYSAFRACDIFVLSATAETQPIVLIEAMVCAKPFVTTDTGAVRDFPGGYVVRSERAMAARMKQLAEDPSLRHELGRLGRQAALKSYTWKRVGELWEELLVRLSSK